MPRRNSRPMLGRTHLACGVLFSSLRFYGPAEVGACLLGSLLPDLDHPRSIIGGRLRPVSGVLSVIAGHRGAFHSLCALLVVVFGLWQLLPDDVLLALAAGFGLHLALDLLTQRGIPLLWPFSRARLGLGLIKTGGVADRLLGFLGLFFGFLVIGKHWVYGGSVGMRDINRIFGGFL